MARTYRKDRKMNKPIRDGERNSAYYESEDGDIRERQLRSVRHATRQNLRNGQYDDLPVYRKTGGWESN